MVKYYHILGGEIKMAMLAPNWKEVITSTEKTLVQSFICTKEFEEGIMRIGKRNFDENSLFPKAHQSILILRRIHARSNKGK
jgi:hypothetical protein